MHARAKTQTVECKLIQLAVLCIPASWHHLFAAASAQPYHPLGLSLSPTALRRPAAMGCKGTGVTCVDMCTTCVVVVKLPVRSRTVLQLHNSVHVAPSNHVASHCLFVRKRRPSGIMGETSTEVSACVRLHI